MEKNNNQRDETTDILIKTEMAEKKWLRVLLQSPDFSWASWISQLLFVTIPAIALVIVYWIMADFSNSEGGVAPISKVLFVVIIFFALALGIDSVVRMVKKKGTPLWMFVAVSFLFISWLMLMLVVVVGFENIAEKTGWLVLFALAILPTSYSMIQINARLSSAESSKKMGKQTLPLVLIPLVWYLLVNTILFSASGMFAVIVLLLTIVATYFFIFLLFRTCYLVGNYFPKVWNVAKLVLIFVLPILCFVITQTGGSFWFFWDYTSPIYYLLVIINGVLLLLPEPKKNAAALLLFFARTVIYLVVTYFFVVISPFYSVSLVGLLLGGVGLLVLTPLFLWAYQTKLLVENAKVLFKKYGTVKLAATIVLGLVAVPLVLFISFLSEKSNLEKALLHANSLDTAQHSVVPINAKQLERTISFISADQNSYMSANMLASLMYGNHPYYQEELRTPPPFLTGFHNKVLDVEGLLEKTNSNVSFADLETLFANVPVIKDSDNIEDYSDYSDPYQYLIPDEWEEEPDEPDIPDYEIMTEVIGITTEKEQDYYRTMVHFRLTNMTLSDNMEYYRLISLPQGVFVSDYYLDVFEERKEGLLAETTSAQWIYNVITSRFLDPGLVTYTDKGISFQVFPFGAEEVRYTGIEFLHRDPFTIQLDNLSIESAPTQSKHLQPVVGDGIIFVGADAKEHLESVKRDPFYVFAVDCSFESDVEKLAKRIEVYMEEQNIPPDQASVSAINFNRTTWSMTDNWSEGLLAFPREGGFGYGLMINQMLREVDSAYYPVLIVLKDDYSRFISPTAGEDLVQLSPETGGYYELLDTAVIHTSFTSYSQQYYEEILDPKTVKKLMLEGSPYYLLDDTPTDLIYTEKEKEGISERTDSRWLDALNFLSDQHQIRQMPEEYAFNGMLQVVQKSFEAKIMSPYTSYIVLELEEQEDAMYRRQDLLLSSETWTDFYEKSEGLSFTDDEDMEPGVTSEPGLLLSVVTLFIMAAIYHKRKKLRKTSSQLQ